MPARADHHQSAVAEPETGGVLVPMLVRLRLAGKFIRCEMMVRIGLWVAPQAVLDADLHPGVGDNMLDAGARHHTGSEGMSLDDGSPRLPNRPGPCRCQAHVVRTSNFDWTRARCRIREWPPRS